MKIKDLQKKMMSRAIDLAREGRDMDNGGPFGAVITKGDEIIAESCNKVLAKEDCTEHAELRAIQKACRKLNSSSLQGCVLFTSCEPCMMCLGAAYWADFDNIYYGASALDAKEYGFKYSDMYYKTDADKRHQEFKMIQLCRDKAVQLWS
ncbi:nucleoside deaminase [Christiangramia forsetii]|uniref:Cytidine/deoxycytidylate deaminase family protein n=2 Tax=Christiangramia forsetii TaxID=411153 RepID=A0M1S8_CHRFK|nr:nucleoside deaminase [Christiangramia forsetii]GGG45457.1 tRNA-specific adenosine deaminase [Christiangramia forsetii]CAL66573.1 cytidine/deoxycytidylate deaminase family protein [Christiangramia forsetii KT0803]